VFALEQFTISPLLVFFLTFLILSAAAIAFLLTNKKVKQYIIDLFPQKAGKKKSSFPLQVIISFITFLFAIFVVLLLINID
jgi:hypothetical protein